MADKIPNAWVPRRDKARATLNKPAISAKERVANAKAIHKYTDGVKIAQANAGKRPYVNYGDFKVVKGTTDQLNREKFLREMKNANK